MKRFFDLKMLEQYKEHSQPWSDSIMQPHYLSNGIALYTIYPIQKIN